ncbi:MAG: hemolysin family protein, partial [Dehalococcoidia bacterium]
MVILLVCSVLAFLGLHGADAALPLLRRGLVRDSLKEGTLQEAAVRRLRSSRAAYEDVIWLLTLMSTASTTGLALGALIRLTDFGWLIILAIIAAGWIALVLLIPLVEFVVEHLSVKRLAILGVFIQMSMLPLLPLRRMSRSGLRLTRQLEGTNGAATTNGNGDGVPHEISVEDEIADEALDPQERAMIRAILNLGEIPVREIMVPRVDVVALDVSTPLEEAVLRLLESGHSRLPVYEEKLDNVVGVLYSRDLLAATTRGSTASPPTVADMVRAGFFVPESKRVDEMLSEFQDRRVHLAVVVDEYGGVAGIVTIEDLIEEIVGEIQDEFDMDEPSIERWEGGEAIVDARMPVDKFNEEFGAGISGEGFDTVGGFLFSRLGRIPTAGDVVTDNGLRMQVVSTAGRRIKKISVTKHASAEELEAATVESTGERG